MSKQDLLLLLEFSAIIALIISSTILVINRDSVPAIFNTAFTLLLTSIVGLKHAIGSNTNGTGNKSE